MRFYQGQHTHYLGIDLHVENMYLCILDSKGEVLLHKNIKTKPELFLLEIAPYREGLVVGCECMYTCLTFRALFSHIPKYLIILVC